METRRFRGKCIVIVLMTISSFCYAKYSGGDGTSENPYQIANVNDLLLLGADANDYSKSFILINDINLAGYDFKNSIISADINEPYSYEGVPFRGMFNGNNHIISSLYIDANGTDNRYQGLFGMVAQEGVIKNLRLKNIDISGHLATGGLCGENSGTIINCYTAGLVKGEYDIGGICGINSNGGVIFNCFSNSDVFLFTTPGGMCAGGLCGENNGSSISNCYASGKVNGMQNCGGLCGNNIDSTINNCYSIGQVTGSEYTGGLCGSGDNSTITSSYFLDNSGPDNGIGTSLTANQMKNESSFEGWDFAGRNPDGTSSYWVIYTNNYPTLFSFDSSFIPYEFEGQGTESDPYLINNENDLGAIWEKYDKYFKLTANINLNNISWSYSIVPFFSGNFDGNNHTISNLSNCVKGNASLFGQIDKKGFVQNLRIQNMSINTTNSVPYFDGIGGLCNKNYGNVINCFCSGIINGKVRLGGLCGINFGFIKNCSSSVSITGNEYTGGLCGRTYVTIEESNSTGTVYGKDYTGGLCGSNSGIINKCFSAVNVSGEDYCGGLCGESSGKIFNCYSKGNVTGNRYAGGLCGGNWDIIKYCYSTGHVNNSLETGGLVGNGDKNLVAASFWNIETSSLTESSGGNGLDTIAMKDMNIYSLNGWSPENWTIDNGNDYPHLLFEKAAGQPIPAPLLSFSGEGTFESPYQLKNAEDVRTLSSMYFLWDKHFILANDIDLEGYQISSIGNDIILHEWDCGVYYSGLENEFEGVVDGNGHSIKHLSLNVNSSEYVGFFKCLGPDAIIKNLGMEDVNIIGNNYVGSIAGINTGKIINCFCTGRIKGNNNIGGLVGINYGYEFPDPFETTITGSYSNCVIDGNKNIGGLLGHNDSSNVIGCYSISEVNGIENVGGLIGYNAGGNVIDSHTIGEIKSQNRAGGLAAYNSGNISKSYSHVTVNGSDTGGIVAKNDPGGKIIKCFSTGDVNGQGGIAATNGGIISESYSNATVHGSGYVGGIVGDNGCFGEYEYSCGWVLINYVDGTIINCYNTGNVSGTRDGDSFWSRVGGICGYNGCATITNCYSTGIISGDVTDTGGLCGGGWDEGLDNNYFLITAGRDNSLGLPLTDTQMKQQASFVDWDFSYSDGNDAVWFMARDGYPILTWQISNADIYTDGKNNLKDFSVIAKYWMREDCKNYNHFCQWADMNFDGAVDIDDLAIFLTYWLERSGNP